MVKIRSYFRLCTVKACIFNIGWENFSEDLNINVKANGITSGAIVRKERAKDWVSSNIFNFFPKINE